MNNIIFLDIDGVLNDNKSDLSLESIAVLKQLIQKYQAKVVIISSQQGNGNEFARKILRDQFTELGIIDIDFINPNFEGSLADIELEPRVLGIVDHLKKHDISNYVILDDEYHNDYKLICLNYYRTPLFIGLTRKDLPKVLMKSVNFNNFQHINYHYKQSREYKLARLKLIKVLRKIIDNQH